MQHRLKAPMAAVMGAAAALMVLSGLAQAQQDERPDEINGHPNLNGIWQAMNTAYWNLEAHSTEHLEKFWELGAFGAIRAGQSVVQGGEIPYRPEAEKQREKNRENWPEADPAAKCYLPGIPRANYMPYPFQIIQGGGDILFAYQFHATNRKIHMSDHQKPPIDTWMGRSNGHWEGDTLVVETTGLNGETWLDRSGNHHSSQMTVTERFTLIDDSHMRYEATITDPKTFTEPWTIEMILYRKVNPDAVLLEYRCVPFSEPLLYHDIDPDLIPEKDRDWAVEDESGDSGSGE